MKKFDSINVIPFIDIMLVLLAIVLTTATFINNGQLDINLPEAATGSSEDSTEKTEIAIDEQSVLYLNGAVVTIEQLKAQLARFPDSTAILLRIDESVPFSLFVSVVDLLKQLMLENVSVLTQKTSVNNIGGGESSQTGGREN
jgi:biopolymer transport protein ExbD